MFTRINISILPAPQADKIDNNLILQASSTNYSTLVGYQAGNALKSDGLYNSFMGYQAGLYATSSDGNTFIGYQSGRGKVVQDYEFGANNTAIGYQALLNNTTGYQNMAVGMGALQNNSTGLNNVAMGKAGLASNTSGYSNVGVGSNAIYSNQTGLFNIGIGEQTVFSTTVSYNIGIGGYALYYGTTGAGNVGIGYNAGSLFGVTGTTENRSITDEYMTFIGYQSARSGRLASTTKMTGGVAIGYNARVGDSYSMALGGEDTYALKVGIASSTPWARLSVAGTVGQTNPLFAISSSTAGYATSTAFIIDNNGKVGIGTTSPYTQLSVQGGIAGQYLNLDDNTSTSTIKNGLWVGSTTLAKFVVDRNTGNVGIGKVPGAYPLDVNGYINSTALLASYVWGTFYTTAAFGSGNGYTWNTDTTTGLTMPAAGTLSIMAGREKIRITPNGNIGIASSTPWGQLSITGTSTASTIPLFVISTSTPGYATSTAFIIDSNGNVGIGTSSPQKQLSVEGTAYIAGKTSIGGIAINNSYGLTVNSGVYAYGSIYSTSDITTGANNKVNSSIIKSLGWQGQIAFQNPSNNPSVSIMDSGKLGVGTTSPYAVLSVAASSTNPFNIPLFVVSTSTASATSTAFVIDSNGKVGVGTTSPYAQLSVQGIGAFDTLNINSVATSTFMGGINLSGGCFSINGVCVGGGTGSSQWTTNGSNIYYSSGYVGIGTTSPSQDFSVAGNGYFTGRVAADSLNLISPLGFSYGGTGTTTQFSTGSIIFATSSGMLAQDSEFVWDNLKHRLVVGTPDASWLGTQALVVATASSSIAGTSAGFWNIASSSATAGGIMLLGSNDSDAMANGDRISALRFAGSANATNTIRATAELDIYASEDWSYSKSGSEMAFFTTVNGGNVRSEKMRIANTGNVGLGTTTPFSALTVSSGNIGAFNGAVCADNGGSVKCFGTLTAGTVYGDASSFAGSDYAEYFRTVDTNLSPGEVVCVDILESNAVKRCNRGHDNNIMGIVSTHPSIVGNASDQIRNDPSHYAIVGMLGQVDAYVSAENGPIGIGDSLTSASSTPGYAMKADGGDSTVGVALEPLKEGIGKIKVLISRRNKSLAVEEVEQLVVERIANMKIEDQVQEMIAAAVDKLDLDPKIQKIAQEEAGKLDMAISVALNDTNGQITYLRDQVSNFQFSIFNFQTIFNDTISNINSQMNNLASQTASTTALAENIRIDEQGNLVIGHNPPTPLSKGGEEGLNATFAPKVQIIEPTQITASSTGAAFVVNQTGSGDIADFQNNGVSVLTIADTGEVKVMGSLLVDGRIMLCTGGNCSDTLDSSVDETMADLGVEGKVVAGAFEGYCDDGFIWVPGSAKYGTLPGFCVMSDLAFAPFNKGGEGDLSPESPLAPLVKGGNIWTVVSQGEAQLACQSLGTGYHLLSENEWLTIAENILQAGDNDMDKTMAGMQLATSTAPFNKGGEGDLIPSTIAYKLTNDNIIYNLTGAVSQWTNQNVTSAGTPVINGGVGGINEWAEYADVTDYKGLNIAPDYYLTDANNNIGKIFAGIGSGLRGFVRGAAGIYGLDLSHAPSEQSENIGFRCGK